MIIYTLLNYTNITFFYFQGPINEFTHVATNVDLNISIKRIRLNQKEVWMNLKLINKHKSRAIHAIAFTKNDNLRLDEGQILFQDDPQFI